MEVSADTLLFDLQQLLFGNFNANQSQLSDNLTPNTEFSNLFSEFIAEFPSSLQNFDQASVDEALLPFQQNLLEANNRQDISAILAVQATKLADQLSESELTTSENVTELTKNIAEDIPSTLSLWLQQSESQKTQQSNVSLTNRLDIYAQGKAKPALPLTGQIEKVSESRFQQANSIDTSTIELEAEIDTSAMEDISELMSMQPKEHQQKPSQLPLESTDSMEFLSEDISDEIVELEKFTFSKESILQDKNILMSEPAASKTPINSSMSETLLTSTNVKSSHHRVDSTVNTLKPLSADEDFAENFAEQMQILVSSKKQQAQIQLEPVELGKLDIQISTNKHNEYTVNIVTQNEQAQQWLDQHAARLKENFSEQQLQFNFTKQEHSEKQNQSHQEQQQTENTRFANNSDEQSYVINAQALNGLAGNNFQSTRVNIFA